MTLDTVDLDTCDREPIHLIGAVQPHGALIALDADTLVASFASGNTEEFLGWPAKGILGASISRILGDENAAELRTLPLDPSKPELLKPWFIRVPAPEAGTGTDVECLPHRSDGHLVLEFLRHEPVPASVWEDEYLRRGFISELTTSGELVEVAEATARIIREVTGFDRVMVYKFAEDKHGEVIAEATNRPDRFLGLHYPASDIPDPARRHFLLNVMRSIPDINGARVPILSRDGTVANAASARPLDLTYSKLRAVAPVHVEYLNNMGVAASLSISLITNNELWGLVACHHYAPRSLSSSRLRFAELVGATASTLLQSIENSSHLQKSIDAEKTAYRIEGQAGLGTPFRALVAEWSEELMDLVHAQGLLLVRGDEVASYGTVPEMSPDYSGLRDVLADGVATTSRLSDIVSMDDNQMVSAAGAAYLDLSDDGTEYLVFLRCQFDETINWAGKPEKMETRTEDGVTRLSPRGSFALWREERHGQSRPFDARDKEALRILRRALFALNSLEREREAREAQKVAEHEEARLRHALLEASRASSMGELATAIAHELNQPLSAISNFVAACRRELENAGVEVPERATHLIGQALAETRRAGDLLHRVRNFVSAGDLHTDHIDLNNAIRQGVNLAIVSSDLPNLQVNFLLDENLPKVHADPVQIGQVVLNLARNSITAMREAELQKLTLEVTRSEGAVRVFVRDTGIGIAPEQIDHLFEPFHASTTHGMGIGLSLCRSIVEAHGGRIWTEPTTKGAVLVFELPINGEPRE